MVNIKFDMEAKVENKDDLNKSRVRKSVRKYLQKQQL